MSGNRELEKHNADIIKQLNYQLKIFDKGTPEQSLGSLVDLIRSTDENFKSSMKALSDTQRAAYSLSIVLLKSLDIRYRIINCTTKKL